MECLFTQHDLMLLEKEVKRKSFADIAFLLDKTKEEILLFVPIWCKENNVIPYQQILDGKKQVRGPRAPRAKKEKAPKIFSRQIVADQKVERKRRNEPKFKTQLIDYSQMQTVRVDDKTLVYCKPGETPAQAKEKYLLNKATVQFMVPAERESTFKKK